MKDRENYLLFVYGSLKRGFGLHEYIADQNFCGAAKTVAEYQLFDCGSYPALVRADCGGRSVSGEVYEVTPGCLAVLDEVEGVPQNLYDPQKVNLLPPFDCETVLTYIYQKPIIGLREIPEWPGQIY